LQQAAAIIGTVHLPTLWRWAKKGHTPPPYDIDLGIIRQPVVHHANPYDHTRPPPLQHRAYRMLIPAEKVRQLRDMLSDHERHSGSFTKEEVTTFAARAARLRSPPASHLPSPPDALTMRRR